MKKTGKQNIRWNTMKILAVGFLSVIFLGAVLLWLPVSNEKSISFLDALFTSTSSVCVTGLVTIVPKYQFTITGKVILLILIQIGGLGVIACITAFFMLLKRKITVKERVVIQEAYNMNSLGGLVGLVRKILIGTVVVEGIGAVFYAIQFIRDYGVAKGIWYGIFHSISAFCNAGIDILGDDSLARYATDPLINIITMLLIILGGIGFTVWYDVIDNGKKIWHREIPGKCWFTRLKLHSKIAIITTGFLLIAGTVLNFALEYHNPATIGHLNTGQKLMVSAFQAVTTRTAGFSTFQQSGMYEETGFLNIIFDIVPAIIPANIIPSICFSESDNPERGHPSASPPMCLMQLHYHTIYKKHWQDFFTCLCFPYFQHNHTLHWHRLTYYLFLPYNLHTVDTSLWMASAMT